MNLNEIKFYIRVHYYVIIMLQGICSLLWNFTCDKESASMKAILEAHV